METIAVVNAMSCNMLNNNIVLSFTKVSREHAAYLLANNCIESHVGHADMAAVISSELNVCIPMNRDTYKFSGSPMLVAQYSGPRLAEGTTSLPEGANIEYWLVEPIK